MTAVLYDRVRAYHQEHGDDYGSESSREKKYRACRDLLPSKAGKRLLDVGCGTRQFKRWVPRHTYFGIDLVNGENVLDVEEHFDLTVANGLIYRLPDERVARQLLMHIWSITDEAMVWTSKDRWSHFHAEELSLCPYDAARWARKVAGPGRVKLDMSYLPGDFAILMLK